MPRPLLPLAVAFAAGIAIQQGLPLPPAAWLALGALAALAAAILWFRAAAGGFRAASVALFACLGAHALAAATLGAPPHHLSRLPEDWLAAPVPVEGWVVEPPDPAPPETRDPPEQTRLRFVAAVDRVKLGDRWTPVAGRVRLTLYDQPEVRLAYGDEVRATVHLRRPRRFDNPGSFDYPGYLATQGIFLEGWTREPMEVRAAGRGSWVLRRVFALRAVLLERVDGVLTREHAALLKATVLGDRTGLTAEVNQAFLDSGTYHILAISGLNVSLLAGTLFGLLRLGAIPARVSAAAAAMLVTLYAALAGGGASVVRAAVMADVYLLAIVLDRRADLLNTLALSALALLAWNPRVLTDVGFQLTVLATLGIVLTAARWDAWLAPLPRPVRWLAASVGITLAATAMTLPVLAGTFNRLSPVGVLANVPIVPLSGAITALGTFTAATVLVAPAGIAWLTAVDAWLVDLLVALAGWFAGWPGSSVAVPTPTAPMTGAYYAGLAALVAGLVGWRRRLAFAGSGACALVLATLVGWQLRAEPLEGRVRLTMLDVGQGAAVLLETPGAHRVLVDAGSLGGIDVGRHVVSPFLRHHWIGGLDALAITHPQVDHMSGVPAILGGFAVGELWSAGRLDVSPTGVWIEEYVRRHRIPHRVLRASAPPVRIGGASIETLFPAAPGPRPPSREPDSLVLAVRIGDRTALLTGDITARQGEEAVVAHGAHAEVVTVPHHGSRTSSSDAFLAAVRPQVALISAGHRNRFRHPHAEVLARYAATGARVLRTDLEGALTVELGADGIRASGRRTREPREDPGARAAGDPGAAGELGEAY